MSGSYDLRRSMTAEYDQEDHRPQRRSRPVRRPARGPVRHAFKEEVTERPAWFYPVLVGAAVVTASAIVLFMLIGPKDIAGNEPAGTASAKPVDLVIGNQPLRIPASFTQFPRDRSGGMRESVSLYVALPKFTPYANDKQNLFFDNAPNSPIVFFEVRGTQPPLSETERADAVYLPHVTDEGGTAGPSGLMHYQFKDESPFAGEDLFLGKDKNGETVIFRCSRRSGKVPSPSCWRETMLASGLAMNYRFKRPYLKYWAAIDRGLRTLVERFRTAGAAAVPSSGS